MSNGDRSVTPTTAGMRFMLLAASILVVIIGSSLFFLPLQTDVYFSWTIGSPLTASFLGGAYLAAFLLELVAARETVWANARVAVPAVLFFTVLTMVVTFVHLDKFHFDSPHWNTVAGTWVWLVVYVTVPVLMTALWLLQARAGGADPPRTAPLPVWARALLLGQGGLMVLAGMLLLLAPGFMTPLWAWPLTPLTARALGAWGIGLGTASLHIGRENDWRRGRAALAGSLLFGLLQFFNLLRFGSEFTFASGAGVVYILLLVSLTFVGAYGLLAARRGS